VQEDHDFWTICPLPDHSSAGEGRKCLHQEAGEGEWYAMENKEAEYDAEEQRTRIHSLDESYDHQSAIVDMHPGS